jgi:hypothetical protein
MILGVGEGRDTSTVFSRLQLAYQACVDRHLKWQNGMKIDPYPVHTYMNKNIV